MLCVSQPEQFGEFHPRQISLSFSEYVKFCLLNQDSRFPEFVFYYLWQKELREFASGICNAMKRARRHHVSVRDSGGKRWGLEGLEPPNFQKGGLSPSKTTE